MMPTFADLIQRTIVELRQEPGVSVQQYAEEIIAAILQRQFNTFFDHYWWPRYMGGEIMALNGTNGQVTTDLRDKIKRLEDIRYIWYESDPTPLSQMPPMMNPTIVGFRKYYAPAANDQLFYIFPINTTGNVSIIYRTLPNPFLPNDEIYIDGDLLVCATCFSYLADDEDAPAAIKKFQEATARREEQLREMLNKGPVPIGHPAASPFTDWMM
jgi:hypothetical protein